MSFSNDFLWGAASAAYQVEGAFNEDGKGMGIWDALSDGHVKYGENGNIACDHYHRYKEDVALMKEMGLKTYRFSVSWPRIMPEEGVINEKGIRFYKNLVKELKEAGIEPMCTIFHWNLPMWVHEKGGWFFDGISDLFGEYTRILIEELSDDITYWMTINEPACFIGNGYVVGSHAPFENRIQEMMEGNLKNVISLSKNVLLAHGKAVQNIRKYAKSPKIGAALNGNIFIPWEDNDESIREAKELTFNEMGTFASVNWWADPMIKGVIPQAMAASITESEREIIHQPLDFFGFNCYNSANYDEYFGKNDAIYPGMPRTAMDWVITPDALYWAARFFHERYKLPILITENGMANVDFVMSDGKVHDTQRIEYMKAYLKGLQKAVEEGVPVIGYMYWSVMDNFEWAEGYDKRFGLIYVDYQTLKRTRKDSSYWYADVIKRNRVE